MPELTKRDGRHEMYRRDKLATSLARAGLAADAIKGTVDRIEAGPATDTGSLRARIETELTLLQPAAARRYATTRTLVARATDESEYGWVRMNPQTIDLLDLRPGDIVWLSHDGTPAPFSIESHADVGCGQAYLNLREMAAMGLKDGTKLAASSVYHET